MRPAGLAVAAALLGCGWPQSAISRDIVAPDNQGSAGAGPIVVSASRAGDGLRTNQLGGSVTVLDSEALNSRQVSSVADALRDVPGVAVSRAGAFGGLTQLRIRGAEGNHVLVLIDGVEAADPYLGEFDFGALLAEPGARIEVLRGQQSSLYGSDAIGGVVHYITASGSEVPGVALRAEGGSFDTLAAGARFAGVEGDLDYAFTGAYHHAGGYPTARGGTRDVGADLAALGARLVWSPTGNLTVTGVGRYGHARTQNNETEQDPAAPRFGYIIDSPGVFSRSDVFYGLVSLEHLALDGRWSNSITAQITDSERDDFGPFGVLPTGRTTGSAAQRIKGSFVSSIRLGSGSVQHRLTAAMDLEREAFRNTTPSPFAYGGREHVRNLGLVGHYELLWNDALSLGASIRHDSNDLFDDAGSYRVQASYLLAGGTRLRGAAGTGVKNPLFFELFGYSDGRYIGNPDLRPEKSEGWEIGIEQGIGAGAATIGATYFDNRLRDEIHIVYTPDFVAVPANRDTLSRQRGVEIFATARPIPQLRFDAAYTCLHAREDGVVEVRRPKHVASLAATLESADARWSGSFIARYNGRQIDLAYTDPSYVPVRETLDDYVLVNMAVEHRLTSQIAITARVENVLDQRYEEVFSFAAAGRSAYGGVQLRF